MVEDIEGRVVVDNSQTTIQINKDNSVTGSTGVNRYMSTAIIDGQQIKLTLARQQPAWPARQL